MFSRHRRRGSEGACLKSCHVTVTWVSLCFGYRTPAGGGGVYLGNVYTGRLRPKVQPFTL